MTRAAGLHTMSILPPSVNTDSTIRTFQAATRTRGRRGYGHFTALRAARDAVFDRVLHQRLQDEARDVRIEQLVGHIEGDAQLVLKADLLDLDVPREKVHLLP